MAVTLSVGRFLDSEEQRPRHPRLGGDRSGAGTRHSYHTQHLIPASVFELIVDRTFTWAP